MLSVIVITKNEAQHIGRCLASVAWADEIIVLDSGSTDATVELCKHYTDQVFSTDWPGFGIQKQRALAKASHPWVLSIDADEEISPALRAEIQQTIKQSAVAGFFIPRLSSYCGRQIKHGGWWPDHVLRLFKREHGQFTRDLVHERVVVNGDIGYLQNPILHESFVNLAEVLDKVNSYSSLNAAKLFEAGKKTSVTEAVGRALWNFAKTYVLKGAFLDGRQGFLLAVSNAEGTYYKYVKLLELQAQSQTQGFLISVVVSTYNRPDALKASLDSLLRQTDRHFEILVADDGSTADTVELVAAYIRDNPQITIKHVYQEDKGFRLSRIRNQAVINSAGEYVIFMDGDCLALPGFVARHRQLASKGWFVAGNRVLINQSYTQEVLEADFPLYDMPLGYFFKLRLSNKINRFISFIPIPCQRFRYWQPQKWRKAIGCNTAFWKQDLLAVNGYDENFEGWGYEDSDLLIRLLHHGIKRKEGRFAVPVLHLWHKQNDRSQHDSNYQRLMQRLDNPQLVRSQAGIDQYL